MLGSMESKVRAARQAFNCLLYRGDLNTNGWPLATNGGIPSSTVTGCPSPQTSGQPDVSGSTPANGLNLTGIQYWPSMLVTMPDPTGLSPNSPNAYPQPPAPPSTPLTTQAHSAGAAALVAKASAATTPAPAAAPTFPTTGNLCLDIMLNYVDASQVSSAQLGNCAMKGYSGNRNGSKLTPAMIAWRAANYSKLPKVPDNPNVTQYDAQTMKGMGQWDGGSFLQGIIAAVGLGASAVYLFKQAKKMGYV